MRTEQSLYEVLDVAPAATTEQIRRAYRAAARRTHPDTGGSSPAFERVALAYRVLGDPDRRRRYDLRLTDRAAPAGGAEHPGGATTTRPPGAGAPAPAPGADPVVRRRYLALMMVALSLFITAGTIVRLVSIPAAMIMMVVAAMIPPVAVTVAGRPRQVRTGSATRVDPPARPAGGQRPGGRGDPRSGGRGDARSGGRGDARSDADGGRESKGRAPRGSAGQPHPQ